MEPIAFEIYTERLQVALESVEGVIGLVTLGTTADPTFRDEWSDHDFWVITETGAQDSLIKDLSWLPDADEIAITVSHGNHRRTVVYRNRHKAEFAVFDVNEALEGKTERYHILFGDDSIAKLMESVHRATIEPARAVQSKPDALENLCVLVWSACERYWRGEFLSAHQYLHGFAMNQLLSLISVGDNETSDNDKDVLDPRRRLELRSPELAEQVLRVLEKPIPQAAIRLLEIAEKQLKQNVPSLAWEKVSMVREWIHELDGNGAPGGLDSTAPSV